MKSQNKNYINYICKCNNKPAPNNWNHSVHEHEHDTHISNFIEMVCMCVCLYDFSETVTMESCDIRFC